MFFFGTGGPPQQGVTPPAVQPDTAQAAVVQTPLPRGVGAFVRAVFNAPSWLQIAALAGALVAFVVVVAWLWRRRAPIRTWLATRSRGWKIALAGVALLAVTGAGAFGTASWTYMQHNNDFCIGCHVMGTAWTRFQHSEHRKLKCHDCHQQSIFASMRQLYLWVAERPNSIPPHAKVPTTVCKTCHDQAHPDRTWKHVVATAGHSVHLRNDKPALRNVQCVTCHGAEVHHFVPLDRTCGQSGCHEKIQIKLGKMAAQTSMHCTGCHNFTSEVADNISPDSARTSLVPTGDKCLDCHPMKERLSLTLAEFERPRDPHKNVCGDCHDPHKQTTTSQAFASCATAQCHARADTLTPFHRGLPKSALANCGTCHKAHVWKVPSKDCVACHRDLDHPLRGAGVRKPPAGHGTSAGRLPGDTLRAPEPRPDGPFPPDEQQDQRPSGPFVPDDAWPAAAAAPAPTADAPPRNVTAPQARAADTLRFSHSRHKTVQCSACHSSERSHGALTITKPAGCLQCHHGAAQKAECTTCHTALVSREQTVNVAMTVWNAPRTRTLLFAHDRHAKLECKTCHATPTTLAPNRTCASCHAEHHAATANCASCHPAATPVAQTQHPRQATHAGCGGSGCHQDAAILALPPSRGVCLACHREQVNHQPGGDCASCHLVTWTPGGAP